MEPGRKATCFYSICRREVANFYFIYGRWEPVQLTTFKYGANNPKWSPMVKNIILIKYFITRTTKDSILNKSYTVPTWTMENQGLKE
jgi:hypothetical protein